MTKKYIFAFLSIILSAALGFLIGKVDITDAFINGALKSAVYAASSILAWYAVLYINFLLSFSDRKKVLFIYGLSSILFSTLILATTKNTLFSFTAVPIYFLFLLLTEQMAVKRSKMFVRFLSNEILIPVVRTGTMFLLIVFGLMGFFQGQKLISGSTSGVSGILQIMVKPTALILNKTVEDQLNTPLAQKISKGLGTKNPKTIAEFILKQTINSMYDQGLNKIIGIPSEKIPVDKLKIDKTGKIDTSPVIATVVPIIAQTITTKYPHIIPFIPLAIALVIVSIIQPVLIVSTFILKLTTPFITYIFLKSGILKKEYTTVEKEIIRL